ncbi:MAG: AlpA family phage regulatory protein [Gammaproteobacteria bacterium]|nr:AlpA family phage regulatory protein [Gammaproteobacteria bacterium]
METSILRLPEVIRRTGLSKVTIYRRMKAGTFPGSVRLGERARGWRSDDVQRWIDERKPSGEAA